MPGFFTRDRPDRASPRKTKKAGDFPARKPGEPSVTGVTRRIEFHLLYPWQVTLRQRHWAWRPQWPRQRWVCSRIGSLAAD
jgi:hypothetical protein